MTQVINIALPGHVLCCIKTITMKHLIQYNLSFTDIAIRYAVIMALGIAFGFTQWYVLIVLAVAVFISAVTGICPLYNMLGIHRAAEWQYEK
jgi:hypothetical protein